MECVEYLYVENVTSHAPKLEKGSALLLIGFYTTQRRKYRPLFPIQKKDVSHLLTTKLSANLQVAVSANLRFPSPLLLLVV